MYTLHTSLPVSLGGCYTFKRFNKEEIRFKINVYKGKVLVYVNDKIHTIVGKSEEINVQCDRYVTIVLFVNVVPRRLFPGNKTKTITEIVLYNENHLI